MENLYLKHRCYHFESTGRIVYDPVRNGVSEPWSAIVEIDQDFISFIIASFTCASTNQSSYNKNNNYVH